TPREHRRRYLQTVLSQSPDFKPGTRAQYSNAGYVVLGAVLEQLYQEEWEQLARRMLFQPLGMTSAGFGPMASPDKVDQPWQHRKEGNNKVALGASPLADNAPVLGPAGRVHCSLIDWAKFIQAHLPSAQQRRRLVKPATLERMHTPIGNQVFGMGWLVVERDWAGGKALTHAGSNTLSYAVVWVAPRKNSAVMVATNQGGTEAQSGTDQACARIIREFF
ncbi:MAG: serine hydrolase domain-containing protein, partial [Fimbriimonadales bacterium]